VKGLLRHDLAKGADLRRGEQGTRDNIPTDCIYDLNEP
jgi:hypothetical protein